MRIEMTDVVNMRNELTSARERIDELKEQLRSAQMKADAWSEMYLHISEVSKSRLNRINELRETVADTHRKFVKAEDGRIAAEGRWLNCRAFLHILWNAWNSSPLDGEGFDVPEDDIKHALGLSK